MKIGSGNIFFKDIWSLKRLKFLLVRFYKVKNANVSAYSLRFLFNLTVDKETNVSIKPAMVAELIWSLK